MEDVLFMFFPSSRPRRKRRVTSVEGLLVLLTVAAIVFFSQVSMPDEDVSSDASTSETLTEKPRHTAAETSSSLPNRGAGEKVCIPKKGNPIRFTHLNASNYFVNKDPRRSTFERKEKPEHLRDAVADVLAASGAEVIGLCEVGGKFALADLKERLKKRGMDYPHGFVLEREGEERALAILSKYPVIDNDSRKNMPVPEGNGKSMLRGMLDVTVEVPDGRQFRLVGIHLKSKRDMTGTADTIRRREAYAVRLALNDILASQDGMPLLVFGDFNDGPSEPAVQIIQGNRRGADGLTRLKPADSRGERWTHFYVGGEEYLSYDHLLMNRTLRTRLGRDYRSGIIDIPNADEASDHRAIWLELR